ncbi:jumping translocation breakpoint protein JTBR [Cotesia typhae]|uniref:jumping translocation breakpoint protein JTBR n=1 Tax=Cotesia typhae TaxID=2053667 RepID=UPI003D69552E
MIESCTKKRMLLAVTLLGGLTVLVLIVESQWTDSTNNKPFIENLERNATCTTNGDYEIITECHPCTAFEIASKSIGVCIHSRYKEILRCKTGETVTRSCDRVAWLEEREFFKFQGVMFVLSFLSCVTVFWRENILRKRIIRKVAKQLRASV